MPLLYFDNFRGFEMTFLPLRDINFFVGENSTGKTSVLKLIGIISSAGFWHYQKFQTDEINFGSFSDIINSNVSKNFFEVGILETATDSQKYPSAIKFKFIEKDNSAYIKEICFILNNFNVQISVEGTVYKYKFAKLTEPEFNNDNSDIYFRRWLTDNRLSDEAFVKVEAEFTGIISTLFQLQTILSTLLNEPIKFRPPSLLNDLVWQDASREGPKKIYDSFDYSYNAQGKHTPFLLRRLLNDKIVGRETLIKTKTILKRFGKDSGLFDDIDINAFGDRDDSPFEISVTLNEKRLNLVNVGYGLSQILTLIIDALANSPQKWYAIQQPEVHLHPKAQAALGDFLYKSNSRDEQKYIIETHSDYIIDRLRLRINRGMKEKVPINTGEICQVVFFSRSAYNNKLEIIEIQEDGAYSENQPKEFRDFFINEQFELINI